MRSYNCCCQRKVDQKIIPLAGLLKIAGEENRLKILCILKNGRHCVCEILKHLKISQSLVSHHLADLKKIGLVFNQKEGQKVYYNLTELGKKLMELLEEINKRKEEK